MRGLVIWIIKNTLGREIRQDDYSLRPSHAYDLLFIIHFKFVILIFVELIIYIIVNNGRVFGCRYIIGLVVLCLRFFMIELTRKRKLLEISSSAMSTWCLLFLLSAITVSQILFKYLKLFFCLIWKVFFPISPSTNFYVLVFDLRRKSIVLLDHASPPNDEPWR